jgi:ankyrin repeat protein
MLSFRVSEEGSSSWLMCKRDLHPLDWRHFPPVWIAIAPGKTFLWEVIPPRIFWGEREWKDVPEPNTGKLVTLEAVLESNPTKLGSQHGIWTGRVTSLPIRALVVDANLRTPHQYLEENYPKQALKIMQADPSWINRTDGNSDTPLHLAAQFGFMDVMKWLLTHGADVNARNHYQCRPLDMAESPEAFRLLVEYKANVNAKYSSGTTLLERLASDYANCQQRPDCRQDSRCVAELKRLRTLADILLEAGAVYDIRSACYFGDLERVQVLVAEKNNALDKRAMAIAAESGHAKIVKLLLEKGADPEHSDSQNLTISHFAIAHPEVLKLLFDAGADPKVLVTWRGFRGRPPHRTPPYCTRPPKRERLNPPSCCWNEALV